jgi:RimJ/RimL family protein N-acetyltransferase
MDPGRLATLSHWVAPSSEAAAKELSVAPFNQAGIRAYEKAGFVEEGRHRESVLHDGHWHDDVLMSLLDHEWAAGRSSGQ